MRWPKKDSSEWAYWFAWHPVFIGYQWFWLEVVQRRATWVGWQYSDALDKDTNGK